MNGGRTLLGRIPRRHRPQHLAQDLVLRAEALHAPLAHHEHKVDAGKGAGPVGDDHDDAAARPDTHDRGR